MTNPVTDVPSSPVDRAKFALAIGLVVAGVIGFYWLREQALLVRLAALFAGLGAGAAVAWFSEPGRRFAVFARESIAEAKRVTWPSQKETTQTTAAVFGFVVIMALFLWLTDKLLEWVLYGLILGWK